MASQQSRYQGSLVGEEQEYEQTQPLADTSNADLLEVQDIDNEEYLIQVQQVLKMKCNTHTA